MADSITVFAPAKINLWLRILRRRDDGFHDLDTRMVTVGLSDELRMERIDGTSAGVEFTCSDPSLSADGSNLVLKALAALEAKVGALAPLRIHLEKRIPHGAGLGGGSSDAAAALRGANVLGRLGLSIEALAEIGASIGSDVPFFLHGGACDCRGRGERVDRLPDFRPRLPILLIKPPFPVPTPWAYQRWRDSAEIPGVLYAPQPLPGLTDSSQPALEVINDLERPVFAKYLLLADLKMWLRARPEIAAALLSGSGSTMIAFLREPSEATALISRLKDEYGPDTWTWQGVTA